MNDLPPVSFKLIQQAILFCENNSYPLKERQSVYHWTIEEFANIQKCNDSNILHSSLNQLFSTRCAKVNVLTARIEALKFKLFDDPSIKTFSVSKSFDRQQDSFKKYYRITSITGINGGANGSIEKIAVQDSNGHEGIFVRKTAQPMIILDLKPVISKLMDNALQKPMHDPIHTIGWEHCTGNEKIAIYRLFGKKSSEKEINNLKELEEAFSEKEIQSYRQTIFGSPAGGQTRLSDTHLKMLAAFGSICLDNQMDLGNAGDKELFTEALVYRHLNRTHHPSILEMISFGRLPKNDTGLSGNYLVLEYAERGSLNDWLEQRSRLCLQEAILFGIQLASGLDFILSRAVLHRDFKMNNILVMKNGKLKITDFGSAASLKNHKNNSSPPGNPDALPPEYGLDHPKQSKFDCWALGFILLEFVTSPKDKLNLRRLKDEIDLLKNTFREAYKTKNRFLIRNAERAILDFITMGDIEIAIHGIETYMLDEFYAGEKAILVQYINIALGLLKPNPAVRTSAVKAHQQLKFLMSHYEF